MPSQILHVTFTLSSQGSLREALKRAGRPDEVVGLRDDLSFGPTNSADLSARRKFIEDVLDYDFDDEDYEDIEPFWHSALDCARERVVWVSQWSTMEYCGFLEWLRRNEGKPFQLVDLTNTRIAAEQDKREATEVGCVSLLNAEAFLNHSLWSRAVIPPTERLQTFADLWARLRSEAAPLRVITPDGLASAPLTYFDQEILKCVGSSWSKANHVVGHALAAITFDSFRSRGVFQCLDFVLFSRLRSLIEEGAVQVEGDVFGSAFLVCRPS